MNKRNLFILSTLSIMTLLIGCYDETKSLVVFDEIGVDKNTLGIYRNNDDGNHRLLSLCYKNSRYRANYILEEGGYLQGNFVPSKVKNTKDFYIYSFPEINGYGYNKDKKIKSRENHKNAIIYSKVENNNLLLWLDFLSDEDEKKSTSVIKQIISKLYSKTFTQKSMIFKKIGECSSVNNVLLKIDNLKNRYSHFKEGK